MSIYCWGLSKHGQAGPGESTGKVINPALISVKKSHGNVIDVSAGGLFTAAITDKKTIITFGCGKYGRLGNDSEDDQKSPVVYSLNCSGLKNISCGLWHCCVLDVDGSIYMWGHGKPCGNSAGHNLTPVKVTDVDNIAGMSCGYNYTLVWTSDGKAYSWGSNQYGVLGHGHKNYCEKPMQIKALNDVKVVSMNAGFAHCGAVTDDGKLYMWGQGKFGALGLGETGKKNEILVPQLVVDIYNIKEISCSVGENHGHTLIVTSDGVVLSSGDGYKGKLGLGNQDMFFSFQQIPVENFSNEFIDHVSSGGIHSAAVSKDGHVFTWGCGSDGRLGHPEAAGHRYLFRSDSPRFVESLKGHSFRVSASYYHTVALLK